MRVGVDAQLALGTATGIGEFVRELLAALRECDGVEVSPLQCAALDPWRFDRRVLWDQLLLPLAARRARCDLVHCAAGTAPVAAPPFVVTVHDVAWLRVQGHARPYARAYFGAFQLGRYRAARRLLTDSAFSRTELAEVAALDPAAIAVVEPGVARDFATLERRPDASPFVLAAGTVERRKNLEVLLRALRDLPGLRLISVGPPTPYLDECRRLAGDLGLAERVEFRGYVPRAELLDLYARATVAAVPSHYEGFGYAVAQARCAGVPLAVAATSSLPDVAGGTAALLDPGDPAAWSAALAAAVAERESLEERAAAQRGEAIARFDWARAAAATVRVYREALG